jgi:hypothetical protein
MNTYILDKESFFSLSKWNYTDFSIHIQIW